MGNRWGMARATNHLSYLLYKAGRFQEAATVAADALTLFAGSGNLSEGSQSIENLADMAGALRQGALAARLYGIAEGLQERLGTPMWPSYRIEYEQEVARVRSLLEPTELQTAWNEGKSLPKDRMVSEALAAANRLASMRAPVEQTDPAAYGLTSREIEVLQLLATGASNRVIAETLFISLATVKGHVQNIMRKLGLRSRTALATFALQHELVTSAQADRK
ncbi:MAG: response regulator transcription factor [Thermomicrobiales bacterium]|nr:response regulator transcription factor [Thermomicrobiales bacterium]